MFSIRQLFLGHKSVTVAIVCHCNRCQCKRGALYISTFVQLAGAGVGVGLGLLPVLNVGLAIDPLDVVRALGDKFQ